MAFEGESAITWRFSPFSRNWEATMGNFLLWCLLLVVCWPLAILAIVVYPIVWLLLLPFRLVGVAVGGLFEVLTNLISLPFRLFNRLLA